MGCILEAVAFLCYGPDRGDAIEEVVYASGLNFIRGLDDIGSCWVII